MITHIENNDFNEALSSNLAVVDFSATWCNPCRMLAPVLEELSDEMDGEADFYGVDVDENKELATEYSIQSIPAIVILSNGEEVARMVGFRPKEELEELIKTCM